MPIRIALLNAHNTLNYGTMMMCENVIAHLDRGGRDVVYVVPASDQDLTLSRLGQATGQGNIEVRDRLPGMVPRWVPRAVRRLVDGVLLRYLNGLRSVKGCRFVVILGGDDLSEYYGKLRLMDIFLRLVSMRLAGKKVILLGQTVGPFTGIRKAPARFVLNRMEVVFHRGPESARYAREELECDSPQDVAGDLAFLPLARGAENDILGDLGLEAGKYMVFVPSGLSGSYCADASEYVEGLAGITRELLELDGAGSYRVVVLPHVLQNSDDRPLVRSICDRLDSPRVVGLQEELLPYQARVILGHSRMNFSQRMHGAISSLQQGVPVVALSYSVKYKDVLGRYLGLDDLVVESDPKGFGATVERARTKVFEVWRDLETWNARVAEAMLGVEEDAARQLECLAKLVAEA